MRFAGLAVLAVTLALVPFQAHADAGKGTMFGGFYCRSRVPCDQSDAAFPTAPQIVQMGNGCITQNTGLNSPTGFFEEAYGVDSSGCLTTKTEAFNNGGGMHAIPQCCVQPLPSGGGCAIHCDMMNP